MKITNFQRHANGYPTVDVTTGIWPFRKTVVRQVCQSTPASYWFFVDTGRFTPGYRVEELVRSYDAKKVYGL